MSAPAIPLIYNPDLVRRDTLVRSFVVREALLAEVLDDLRCTTSTRQHHLFVGQRGMGKSTLLHRIAYGIDDDAALSQRWSPLLFPEEQYNVLRLSDLLSNTVDALAERLEGLQRAADAAALDRAVQTITGNEELRQGQLLGLLRRHAKKEGVRLVLLIDNLDMTLERIGAKSQWRLREILQGEDWLVLVGAGTSMHESTWAYDQAFYDFFQVHELKGLDYAETHRLLGRLAEMHEAHEVTRALEVAPAKLRALHRLTGGNPRTLSLLFNVLRRAALGDIADDLTALLDLSTPLYKHRLESLAPQQQRVVDALALHWAPMTAGELAAVLGQGVNDVSSQLSRLVRDGVVETLDLPDTTKAGHQIAERFFNVWYLMRAGRRLRKQLDWLVRFLRDFYEASELEASMRAEVQRGGERVQMGAGAVQMLLAYADALQGGALCRAVKGEALAMAALMEQQAQVKSLLEECFDLDGTDRELATQAERMANLKRAREALWRLEHLPQGITKEEAWEALSGSVWMTPAEKERVARALQTDDGTEMVKMMDMIAAESFVEQSWGRAFGERLRQAVRTGLVANILDVDGMVLRQQLEPEHPWHRCALVIHCIGITTLEGAFSAARYLDPADGQQCLPWYWAVVRLLGDAPGTALQRAAIQDAIRAKTPAKLGWRMLLVDIAAQGPRWTKAFVIEAIASVADGEDAATAEARSITQAVARMFLEAATQKPETAFAPMRQIVDTLEPADGLRPIVAMAVLAGVGWEPATSVLRPYLSARSGVDTSAPMVAMTEFARAAVASGHARSLRLLLDEVHLAARWRPLAEALDCIVARDTSHLLRLPAEIGAATRDLLAVLSPDLPAPVVRKKRPRAYRQ